MTTSGESSARSQKGEASALRSCLRQAGYTVAVASRQPVEGRPAASRLLDDIVVLDPARMGVTGLELERRLRDAAFGGAIALTGHRAGRPADSRAVPEGPGRLRVDTQGRRIFVDETELRLSPKERDLLAYLLRRPGVALTRTQLLHDVWGRDGTEMVKTVDVHVRWLRQCLASYEPLGVQIVTVRGTGYRLDVTG